MKSQTFKIGRSAVGPGQEPVFWPDIDVYFKRDIDLALHIVDRLQAAGVHVVKAAALHDPDCCMAGDGLTTSYHVPGQGTVTEPYRNVIERHVISLEALNRICAYVRQRGLDLVLSVYDTAGIDLATKHRAAAIKIPSSNIVHQPLIRRAAATGMVLVLDTGRSQLHEIDRAVGWARQAGAQRMLLQHSPPGPPAAPTDFHLSMMPELGRRHASPYGLSDHFPGTDMLPLAVALGASVIEKGVCADGSTPDIDIAHALPVSQVAHALHGIRLAFAALGTADLSYRGGLPRASDRMGLVARRDLRPGDAIDESNVRFAFPALGIPVEEWPDVAGRRLIEPVAAGSAISRLHLGVV